MRLDIGFESACVLRGEGIYERFLEDSKNIEDPNELVNTLIKYFPNVTDDYVIRIKEPRDPIKFDKFLMLKPKKKTV